jgi:hypothetical protein
MEQILDRLIDDARRKCEEAQRLAILHTNGMAGISRLKVKARGRGVEVDEDDRSLLMKSGELYRESLLLAQRNAIATKANSEATLTGNTGFCFPNQTFRDGKCVLMWKMQQDFNKVWSKVEYVGSSRKIVKLRIRPIVQLPADIQEENSNDFKWHLVVPTSVVLQVATVSTEGEFVDCAEASLENNDNDWVDVGNIRRTNKSKMWKTQRVVIKRINHHHRYSHVDIMLDLKLNYTNRKLTAMTYNPCMHFTMPVYPMRLQFESLQIVRKQNRMKRLCLILRQ